MHIYLVRHGEKQKAAGDPGLTERGIQQAEETAEYFTHISLDKIISSPLRRTVQTAEIIAHKVGMTSSTDTRLVERSNWNGETSFEAFVEDWRKASRNRTYQPLVGDTSVHAGQRLEDEIQAEAGVNNLLLVTHGGIITDFLRNIQTDEYLLSQYFHTYENLRDSTVPECSITQIEKNNNKFEIVDLCNTAHLSVV